ncbi:MAG: leucyl aminopeptidase [Microcoleaceae cyanobacterium]
MEFRAVETNPLNWTGDVLAIGISQEQLPLSGTLAQLDETLNGTLQELIEEQKFEGKLNTSASTRVGGNSPIRKVVIVGLGATKDLTLDHLRSAAATSSKLAKTLKGKHLGISLPTCKTPEETAQAITEGVILALHQDHRFKSENDEENGEIKQIDLLELAGTETGITQAEKISSGVLLARELVNAPANEINPITMAEMAEKLATDYGFEIEILEKEDCEKLGMGAFLGVAMASDLPPKFIHLTYKPEGTPSAKLGIIGKGLTFDSGGLNLKTGGSGIETMKMDMGGAGATFGAAKAIGQLKPNVEVHFISAVTENMISGHAMRPGDFLTASNGKTIEVNNTDAEGRLTLADALVFADKLGLDSMVDLATLTGACVVALGSDIAGLWSPDETLATQLKAASETSGEKLWQMPLEEKYFEGLKALHADMKNTGPRAGGSITAALFLKQFVQETPWAHLDIAGTVWADKDNSYNNSGATGFAVRLLVNWVLSQA